MKLPDTEAPSTSPRPPAWPLQVVAIGLFLLCVAYHLGMAAKGFGAYRDQHLGAALEYAKGKIDLLRPVVVGFNANGVPTVLEFPVWQATAGVLFKLCGRWFGWANAASLLLMAAAWWPLFQIARFYLGSRGAWWTLAFFAAQPLVFYEAGRGGTDGSCLTFAVWFVYFAHGLVRTGKLGWAIPAALFGALTAATKAPFFFCAGLAVLFMLGVEHTKSLRRWALLAAVGLFAAGVFAVWTRHTDKLAAQAEFSYVDLRLSGENGDMTMMYWYFGDMRYRLNPVNWIRGAWRFLSGEFGSQVLVALPIIGFWFTRRALPQFWLAAAVATTLVFTHLVLHHSNYYLMFSPALALLSGAAMGPLEERLFSGSWARWQTWFSLGAGVMLGLAAVEGLMALHVSLDTDTYPKHIAKLIREHTSPDDKLLMEGGGWGGNMFILSDRQGLTIWGTQFLEKPENLERIRQLGFTKLVMISESPLMLAVRQSTPGGGTITRGLYRKFLTPVAEGWKTLFEDEDLLIKALPAR